MRANVFLALIQLSVVGAILGQPIKAAQVSIAGAFTDPFPTCPPATCSGLGSDALDSEDLAPTPFQECFGSKGRS